MMEPILVFPVYYPVHKTPLISSLPNTTIIFIIFNTLFFFICSSIFLPYLFITFHHFLFIFVSLFSCYGYETWSVTRKEGRTDWVYLQSGSWEYFNIGKKNRRLQELTQVWAPYYTGRFIMFSVITNIYNKKTKGPTLMEFFTATGKLKKFFFFFDN